MTDDSLTTPPPAGSAPASLSRLAASHESQPAAASLPLDAWIKIAVLGALFLVVNLWQVKVLFYKYWVDANWSHGFILPLFSLYLLYERREKIVSARRGASLWGLAIFLAGLAGAVTGYPFFQNYWISHASLILMLLGLVAYLAGWRVLGVVWPPIVYLLLGMPLPDTLYESIALPLQKLAAAASEAFLGLFGVNMKVDALRLSILSLSGKTHVLTVAEACSGIRSMMAFVALAVAWAYITDRPWWHRLTLVLAGVPIMIACNILRVSLTATMFVIDQPAFGEQTMHELMGMALLVPALGLLMLLSKLLSSLFVEVEEEEEGAAAVAAGPSTPGAGEEAAR
jgi:exosortase